MGMNPTPHGQVPEAHNGTAIPGAAAEQLFIPAGWNKAGGGNPPLYTAAQQPAPAPAPLTDEELCQIEEPYLLNFRIPLGGQYDFARAVEKAVICKMGKAQAPQGETNVQLDIDSNHSAPGQQRDVARSVALGQPMGNGQDQAAGHPSAQGDKLLTVAERNIRIFLRSATFKSESDREAALNCVDVLWAAARARLGGTK